MPEISVYTSWVWKGQIPFQDCWKGSLCRLSVLLWGWTTPPPHHFWLYINNGNAEAYSKAILSELLGFWTHDEDRNRAVAPFDTLLEHLISLSQNVSAALLNLPTKANASPSISLYILKNFVILWVLFTFYTTVGSINLLHKVNEDEKLPSLIFTK